ncbi:histidine phosphatase family protein [Mameliella alba]|nr:histidine phosphatase family protein [Antarctobacter heliothermus]MBY6143994.1 histidine phosphatase family protein [Mameliella alba]MCA0954042.1 histidine phosphatase family protein [Mameliella alba]
MAERAYVAFFRHGAYHQRKGVPSARQPWPLTEDGSAQARQGAILLARMIETHGLTPAPVMHSSHQLRAWQTAQHILQGLQAAGYPVETVAETPDLAERGLGSAANLTLAEIETALRDDPRYDAPPPGWKSDSEYCLPLEGAESLMQAGARVARHIRATAKPGLLTIHVGHGASFRHACHHLGLLGRDDIARLSMFHARPSLICHDPHGRWHHLAGDWKIRAAGDTPKD